jgi:Uma2 family endonuclease
MATATKITTAQQLLVSPELGRCELVQGELIMMSPAGFEHGRIVNNLAWFLTTHVRANDLGIITGAETGFQLARDPDTVRAPDVGFLRNERAPIDVVRGFFDGPPDLAVEVLSPEDRPRRVAAKVREWIQAGCAEVWVVDPLQHEVRIHRAGTAVVTRRETEEIASPDLLPNFRLPVAAIFARR